MSQDFRTIWEHWEYDGICLKVFKRSAHGWIELLTWWRLFSSTITEPDSHHCLTWLWKSWPGMKMLSGHDETLSLHGNKNFQSTKIPDFSIFYQDTRISLSENSLPLNPMVFLIFSPLKWEPCFVSFLGIPVSWTKPIHSSVAPGRPCGRSEDLDAEMFRADWAASCQAWVGHPQIDHFLGGFWYDLILGGWDLPVDI